MSLSSMPISSTPNARRHGIIMLLLSITLIFTVISVALIINVLNKKADPQELANVCGIAMNEMLSRATCPNTEPTTQTTPKHIDAAGNMIGFDYPAEGFSITYTHDGGEGDAPDNWRYRIAPGIMQLLPIPTTYIEVIVDVKSAEMLAAEDLSTYLASIYTEEKGYQNINFTQQGKQTIVTGQMREDFGGQLITFENIYFDGEKNFANANLNLVNTAPEKDTEIKAAWELIKASLDFSKIE